MDSTTWDEAAGTGPGDWGRADTDGVPVRLRNGEPGRMAGVPGGDGACCGELGRGGTPDGAAVLR